MRWIFLLLLAGCASSPQDSPPSEPPPYRSYRLSNLEELRSQYVRFKRPPARERQRIRSMDPDEFDRLYVNWGGTSWSGPFDRVRSSAEETESGLVEVWLRNQQSFEPGTEVSFYRGSYWVGIGTVTKNERERVWVQFDPSSQGASGPPGVNDRCYAGSEFRPRLWDRCQTGVIEEAGWFPSGSPYFSINLGYADGIDVGDDFRVYRNEEVVGFVRIHELWRDKSTAMIEEELGRPTTPLAKEDVVRLY